MRIEVPFEFDLDEAALALAIVYADEPLHERTHALRDGLARAVERRVLKSGMAPPEQAVEAYRGRLQLINVFPDDKTRSRMLKDLRAAQAEHREADPASRPTAPRVRQPAIWAKHVRESDGHPVVRIELPRYFDVDQAARALANVYRDKAAPLRSANSLRLGLQQAARESFEGGAPAEPGEDLVEEYRAILIGEGVFPAPAG